ncbi:hypothetical protein SAMN05421854_12086 [Amycolatopsis rubida]|uniref:Uncharacterized protein n=1 Tax=Amycolatopsis rubida TaxID=112413 RepID=A0A1I6AR29_9PSEU|nr:hypothetical protein SAMN05421854_12086 [Amycolatopsis rubida]
MQAGELAHGELVTDDVAEILQTSRSIRCGACR